MIVRCRLTVGVLLVASAFGCAQQGETPRAFVERAIKAIGGEDKLKQLKVVHREHETKSPAGDRTFKNKVIAAFPDQYRMEQEVWRDGDTERKVLNIGNKTTYYSKANDEEGKVQEASKEELTRFLRGNRAGWLIRILPLKDPAYDLSWLADEELDNKTVKVMLVKHAEMPDVKLWFDPQTALLLQSEYKTFLGEDEKVLRTRYADYVSVDGILMAKKFRTSVDGKDSQQVEYKVVRWYSKVEEQWFAFPEKHGK